MKNPLPANSSIEKSIKRIQKNNEILQTKDFGRQDVRMIALIFVYITESLSNRTQFDNDST